MGRPRRTVIAVEILDVAGALFWGVLACSVATVTIAIERIFVLGRGGADVPQTLARLRTVIRKGEPGELLAFAGEKNSPVPSMLRRFARQWAREGGPAPALLEAAGRDEVRRLELRLGVVASLAVVTPVVGGLALVLAVHSGAYAGAVSAGGINRPFSAAVLGILTGAFAHLVYTLALRRVRRLAAYLDETAQGLLGILRTLPVANVAAGARPSVTSGEEDEFFRPRG